MAVVVNGKAMVKDGPDCEFRCFAANDEARYMPVRKERKRNWDTLKAAGTTAKMVSLLEDTLGQAKVIKIHVSGDFYNEKYFLAWVKVARNNPSRLFYAYTKSVRYWVKHRENIPKNLVLTASVGSKEDYLINKHKLRSATVVYSESEANKLGLTIDKDDSLASNPNYHKSFALLIHGTQPPGSLAAKAWHKIRKKLSLGS
jgi:hypothetical protein